MAEFHNINLFREKTVVYDAANAGPGAENKAMVLIKSNRIALNAKAGPIDDWIVVRGHNVAGTLRWAGTILNQYARNPTVFHQEAPVEWGRLWKDGLSNHEWKTNPANWASLHANGKLIWTSKKSISIDMIEAAVKGGDVTERIISRLLERAGRSIDQLVVEHHSQAAMVLTEMSTHLRLALLERRGGETTSFSFSMFHGSGRVQHGTLLQFGAAILEAQNLTARLERNKSGGTMSAEEVKLTAGRRRELMQLIIANERAVKITYRPERPEFLGELG